MKGLSTIALGIALACAGCDYPRDPDGTTGRVRASGIIRVGLAEIAPPDELSARRFLATMERASGAHARVERAPAETLLARLEAGKLDLVLGDFAEDSPWIDNAALMEPLTRRIVGERVVGLAPVAQNGENEWIGLVERTVRETPRGAP